MRDELIDRIQELAKFYKAVYTGKDQDWILLDYRKNETKEQKKQRKRITKTRTKHVCNQIENIYDRLRVIDKSVIRIDNSKVANYASEKALEERAFAYTKYYNLVDANAHVIFGERNGEPYFNIAESKDIISYSYDWDEMDHIAVKESDESHFIYTPREVSHWTTYKPIEEATQEESPIDGNIYYVTRFETSTCHAFRLGIHKDLETGFSSMVGILEAASELFYTLIWDGSELDLIKATHGIIRTWAYAEPCRHNYMQEGRHHSCDGGIIKCAGEIVSNCNACNGKGLKIPTTSQDIIYFQEPTDASNTISLDKMIHTQTISNSILEMRREDLEMHESKILRTVFNSNQVTRKDITKTATEAKIDQEGIVSALGAVGNKTSELFMWMCACLCDYYEVPDNERLSFHGYNMDFSLDTIESLLDQRIKAISANVPKHVIDVIDYAILKKQHIDNPRYIDNINTWEKFRPFSDKDTNERLAMITLLPQDDPKRMLYYNFAEIKQEIIEEYGDSFYDFGYEKQKSLIYQKVTPKVEN